MNSLEIQKCLTLDFNNQDPRKRQFLLMETGANFLESMVHKRRDDKEKFIMYLKLRNIYYKPEWEHIKGTYTHSITLNMDPSKIGYENTLEYQEVLMLKLIDEIRSEIKNIIVIYEYGKNGKLHWHLLINAGSTRNIQQLFRREFGHTCTIIRRIVPNNGETKQQNVDRIKKYYQKENHNKKCAFLSYIKNYRKT